MGAQLTLHAPGCSLPARHLSSGAARTCRLATLKTKRTFQTLQARTLPACRRFSGGAVCAGLHRAQRKGPRVTGGAGRGSGLVVGGAPRWAGDAGPRLRLRRVLSKFTASTLHVVKIVLARTAVLAKGSARGGQFPRVAQLTAGGPYRGAELSRFAQAAVPGPRGCGTGVVELAVPPNAALLARGAVVELARQA